MADKLFQRRPQGHRRWQDYTGKAATLESTSQRFDEITRERVGVAA
jgi:hypothetical protein